MRQQRRIGQLKLSLRVGVSQRHRSCIETGRARPSRAMLQALLDAQDAPLDQRNNALLAAGDAPAFARHALADAEMAPVRAALAHLLAAHGLAPAFVLDDAWTLLQANRGTLAVMGLPGVPAAALAGGLNLLQVLLAPGGLASAIVNADAVCAELWQRTQHGGQLRFFSAFTTFGAPLEVTAASLRVEHFFPADEATRRRMVQAVAVLPAPAPQSVQPHHT